MRGVKEGGGRRGGAGSVKNLKSTTTENISRYILLEVVAITLD